MASELALIHPQPALLLPCLNEIEALKHLLPELAGEFQVILCDNGSTDGSVEYANSLGVLVIWGTAPREIGRTLALAAASTQAEIICVMDCDGTVSPTDVRRVIAPIIDGKADFVVGARGQMCDSRTSTHRFASGCRNALARRLVRNWALPDLGSVRAFRRSVWIPVPLQLNRRYAWNLDVTLLALERVAPTRVVSVQTDYGLRYGRSKISGSFSGMALGVIDHLAVFARHLFWRLSSRLGLSGSSGCVPGSRPDARRAPWARKSQRWTYARSVAARRP